jgi:glutaminase
MILKTIVALYLAVISLAAPPVSQKIDHGGGTSCFNSIKRIPNQTDVVVNANVNAEDIKVLSNEGVFERD